MSKASWDDLDIVAVDGNLDEPYFHENGAISLPTKDKYRVYTQEEKQEQIDRVMTSDKFTDEQKSKLLESIEIGFPTDANGYSRQPDNPYNSSEKVSFQDKVTSIVSSIKNMVADVLDVNDTDKTPVDSPNVASVDKAKGR
jgi:hypothetical protein